MSITEFEKVPVFKILSHRRRAEIPEPVLQTAHPHLQHAQEDPEAAGYGRPARL
jgi:hypothetical protein